MKKTLTTLLVMVAMCYHHVMAQQALLPFGQISKEAWSAKYLYEPNLTSKPEGDWFAMGYDDSLWGSIEGPIGYSSYFYYNTWWGKSYDTYWLRRNFTLESMKNIDYDYVYLYALHGDGCTIYLNGTEIYSSTKCLSYNNPAIISLTNEQKALLKVGENVVAVQVRDTGGGSSFIDFGLYGYNAPLIINPGFDQNYDGWTRIGSDLSRNGLQENYVMRSGNNTYGFEMYQDLPAAKKGLYRLRVQAFQMVGSVNQSWYRYGKEPVQTRIYLNQTSRVVKNIYDEALYENIYRQDEFITTGEGTYVPNYATSTSLAFNKGMYDNSLFAFNDKDTIRIGIQYKETGMYQWTCFDNFRLDYISEDDIVGVEERIPSYLPMPMPKEYRTQLIAMLTELKGTTGYEPKSHVIIKYSPIFDDVLTSIESYDTLQQKAQQLQNRLNLSQQASPTTREAVAAMIAEVDNAIKNGMYSNKDCKRMMKEMDNISKRLDYTYLAFNITTPGSLGDSILSKVENFVDVTSLKISGTLNDNDFSTIRDRLTNLREIDLSDLKTKEIPSKLFYNHNNFEQIILPAELETIGEYSFYRCYAMQHITLPPTLKSINQYAFRECTNLREIILPESLSKLGEYAFHGCQCCTYLRLPSTLKDIPNYAFYNNYNLKKIEFAEGLLNINSYAFYNNYNLASVKFPTSLRYIGNNAFSYNITLSNIEFNEGLYQLADNAFYDCDALTEITLPSSLVLANESPFDYCDNLRKVTCLSIEPPYMTDQIPYGLNMEGRELYVPALSLNNYKQATGWDRFPVIKPIEYLPENIAIRTDMHLTLPEGLTLDYKPNVSLLHAQDPQYGQLTVNGEGTLSMTKFKIIWDPNLQFYYNTRNLNYCSLVNNSHLRADQVVVDLYTRNDRWSFVCLPFDVRVSDITTDLCEGSTNWVIRKYDGQARAAGEADKTWVRLSADDVIKAGEGFIIQSSRYQNNNRENYSGFRMNALNNENKNNLFKTTDLTIELVEFPSSFTHNRSWNFIGNPYPSYYDTRFMQFQAPITVWDMNNNTYKAYSPADDAYILCPGEAFFVQRPVTEGKIVFSKEGRQTTRDIRTIEGVQVRAESANLRTIANLTLTDGLMTDQTRIVLNDMASTNYELDKDASKFMSNDAATPQLFTTYNGTDYAINERPVADGLVSMSMRIGSSGTHSIALSNPVVGYDVILEDKSTGTSVNLAESEYTFKANAGLYPGRFVVRFVNETTGIEIAEGKALNNEPVYDLSGRKAAQMKGVYVQKGKKFMSNK